MNFRAVIDEAWAWPTATVLCAMMVSAVFASWLNKPARRCPHCDELL